MWLLASPGISHPISGAPTMSQILRLPTRPTWTVAVASTQPQDMFTSLSQDQGLPGLLEEQPQPEWSWVSQKLILSTLPLLTSSGLSGPDKQRPELSWAGVLLACPSHSLVLTPRDLRSRGSPQLQRAVSSTATSCSEIFPLAGPATPSLFSSFICLFRAKNV